MSRTSPVCPSPQERLNISLPTPTSPHGERALCTSLAGLCWSHLPRPPGQLPAKSWSLTFCSFHIEAESQVLVMVQQPSVTGCCDVQHQPALVRRSERPKIQKEQVRLPVDIKEQLTKGRGRMAQLPVSCACLRTTLRASFLLGSGLASFGTTFP